MLAAQRARLGAAPSVGKRTSTRETFASGAKFIFIVWISAGSLGKNQAKKNRASKSPVKFDGEPIKDLKG